MMSQVPSEPVSTAVKDERRKSNLKSTMQNLYSTPHHDGLFNGANHTDASRGIFSDAGRDVNVTFLHTPFESKDTGLLSKLKPIVQNGLYVPCCMDKTREDIFDEIDWWLDDTNAPNILWLTGSPGSGKSAVASSMVSKLGLDQRLGASFFFRRGERAMSDPTALWRTVAYDLAKHDDTFADVVTKALDKGTVDPDKPVINLHYKFLIEEPFTETYAHSDLQSIPVIVIDALDECSDHSQWENLLATLVQWSRLSKMFKLIVTGRDDRRMFDFRSACKQVVLPTGVDVSDQANNDIRRYFEKRFPEIGGLPLAEWPGETILHKLTEQAAGLFIWAETIKKILEQGCPEEQLELILSGTLGAGDNLTKLYKQILDMAFRGIKGKFIQTYRLVISAIVLTKHPFHVDDLHKFLSPSKPTITHVISKLSSVISITKAGLIHIHHLSFSEFLCDHNRCPEDFFIHREKESHNVAMTCLKQMEELKFNICDITTSCLLNEEVEDLPERIRTKISGSLLYSCRFWAVHLRDTTSVQENHQSLLDELRNFLYCRLLFWLEVMSFVKEVPAAITALRGLAAIPWIKDHDTHLSAFATDASRFIMNFDIPISDSVPHIYLSALPFSPSDSLVAQHYQPQFPNTLSIVSGREKSWAPLVNLFRGHKGWVNSVAFSPMEKNLVVSGSGDGSIRVWDVETDQLATKPFEGDTFISSVAFSPDGKKVASGSSDQTVQIWDVKTGRSVLGPLKGHESAVSSVVFSPDGKWIASGSYDMTIRMWDVDSGLVAAQSLFKGHTKGISSVAFSPNGKRIASGSWDSTVRIWDVSTGHQIACSSDHYDRKVDCIAFSPDGRRIASSFENMIRIVDAETGKQIGDQLEGFKEPVNSIAFFPDGKRIVSGSADAMVRIWNVETGQVIAGPFKGNERSILSVMVSGDGRLVVSGSKDYTIRIWNVETDQITDGSFRGHPDPIASNRISPSNNQAVICSGDTRKSQGAGVSPLLRGHTNTVTSVMFSSNGKLVASSSLDKTICIWDVNEGYAMKSRLEGHADAVNSVAFSPDDKWVVSGSEDSTVRVWNLQMDPVTGRIFQARKGAVLSVAFSPDQKNVVSGSKDKTIRIWDVETGAVSNTLTDHTDAVVSVAYSRDGKRLISCSWDQTIKVWDVERDPITAHSFVHTSSVISFAFSPDGNRIVSSSMDEVIRMRDLETQRVALDFVTGHTSTITCVAFSPDGKHIISGSRDQTIRVWDVETGHVAACPYKGHTNTVTSVGFSPNGGQIISGSADSTIRIWDVETPPEHVETRKDRNPPIGGTRSPNEPYDSQTTGWLLGLDPDTERGTQDRLLMWIPQSSRDGLCGINTLDVFGTRPTRLDLSRFVYGKFWADCYSHTVVRDYSAPFTEKEPDLAQSQTPTIDNLPAASNGLSSASNSVSNITDLSKSDEHASDPPKGKSDLPVLLPNTRHLRTATYILVPLTLITVYYFYSIRHRTQL